MTTATQTLAEFLLARIAEDEADARRTRGPEWAIADDTKPEWGADPGKVELIGGGKPLATFTDYAHIEPYHVARWDPARVLAECEAKRRMVGLASDDSLISEISDDVLRLLALPYADHPDYRPEWAPTA